MPINDFSGEWKYSAKKSEFKKLQYDLPLFQRYLEKQGLSKWINTVDLDKALQQGLYFDANIPTGYGVGSSGALCAAILDKFGSNTKKKSLLALKNIFAQMESYFHGTSSGTDPLVSYLNYPILLGSEIQKVALKKVDENRNSAIFLLDTGVKREAGPYIQEFLERCNDDFYDKKCQSELAPLVDDAIHTFLEGKWDLLFSTMHELSLFQYRYFDFMILEKFKNIWLEGLSSSNFKLKICGAGGGGFLLGISTNFEQTQQTLSDYKLLPIYKF